MTIGYHKALVLTALFAGLAYIANNLMLILPNISLAFFIVFLAGYALGSKWGGVTGILAFFLISYFSPFGLAMPQLLAGQLICGGIIGVGGGVAYKIFPVKMKIWWLYPVYALWGLALTGLYMGVISAIDAFIFGPFTERFLLGLGFSILTIVSNLIIFPIMMPILNFVKETIVALEK